MWKVGLIYYLCKVWVLGGTRRIIIKLAGSKVGGLMIVVSSVTIFGRGGVSRAEKKMQINTNQPTTKFIPTIFHPP